MISTKKTIAWLKYTPVNSYDYEEGKQLADSDAELTSQTTKRSLTPRIITLAFVVLLGFLLGIVTSRSAQKTMVATPSSQVLVSPCRKTADEARAHGCVFDVISFCWLHPRCYDSELSERFNHTRQWEWFLDPNRTQPLTHQEIITGEYTDLFVNWEYHLLHCTAMWEKMHRALLQPDEKKAIDSYISSYDHTKHCAQMLLGDRDVQLDAINTIIRIKFPDCGMA